MGYITNTDIEEHLGSATYVQLTDDDGDGVANAGVVDEARLGAEGEINSHLARRYAVPIDLSKSPELAGLLAARTLDLVEYRLRSRRPPVSEAALDKRTAAIEWLRRVAEGTIDLPSVNPLPSSALRGLRVASTGSERVLSREELSGH